MAKLHTSWSQPSLIPIHWPVVGLTMVWNLEPHTNRAMVAYDVMGVDHGSSLLAKGLEWVANHHDADQRAEMLHNLHQIALSHLSPF